MTRVKRGVTAHRRHRNVVKAAKGYRGMRSKNFTHAKNALMKAGLHSYVDRRRKKRTFRNLWIARINAGSRALGVKYSTLIDAMTKKNILINRKMMSEMALNDPGTFKAFVENVMS